MNGGYSKWRLAFFDSLFKKREDLMTGRLWMPEPKHLRFRHGETIAELKVPYHMGADDEAALENAVLGLTALLMKRYEPLRPKGQDQTPSEMPLITVGPLKEKTYRTDIFIADSFEKKLAEDILSSAPYVDSAILFSWLSTEGHGRRLARWLTGLLEKAMKEEAKHGAEEKTAYLALMAAINTLGKKREKIKSYRSKGLAYEKMDLAVGLALFAAFRNTVRDMMEGLKDAGSAYYNPSTETLLLSMIVPRAFISIQSNLLSMTLNPYGINSEVFDALAPVAAEMGGYDGDSSGMTGELSDRIRASSAVLDIVKEAYDVRRFREEALRYMVEFDIPGTDAQEIIYEIYNEDRLIKNFLNDSEKRGRLAEALEGVKKRYAGEAKRSEPITQFHDFLSSFKKSMLKGLLKSAKKEAAPSLAPAAEAYYACVLDGHAEKFGALARGYLADRRGEFSQNMLLEEYNRGRLYRFSTDDRPILKTLETEEEGQLFIDMKNFTRKTLKVKEIAMAEFMKEYFYEPILTAASRYGAGSGVVRDEKGIVLTSLPGDAAVFSGGVAYLVSLTRDIQQIIARYREQLARRLPPGRDAEILEEVHKRFEARKEELRQRRAELSAELERNGPNVQSKLIALGEEEHKLENTYRDELEGAIKGELEAGLFISYGAKAETMLTEAIMDFYGPVKVSIGEKINEAARGTYRNALVRAKLEILLEEERQRKKQKNLKYPFNVYIDRIYSIRMPPELESAFEKLISNRKPAGAQAMAQIMAQEFFTDLKKIISGEPFSYLRLITAATDIYNKGQALSHEALTAYMRETKATRRFFKKTVPVSGLDEEIRESYFFPAETLEFWFGVESIKGTEQVEVFYRTGEVTFKGFEVSTPTAVYEMLNAEGEFCKALVKSHFPAWFEEAKKGKEAEFF